MFKIIVTTLLILLSSAIDTVAPPEPAANACSSNYGCADCRFVWGIWTCWGCSGCSDMLACEGDVFSCGAGSCFTGSDDCVITSSSDSCCGTGPNS